MSPEVRIKVLEGVIQHNRHLMEEAADSADYSDLAYAEWWRARQALKAAKKELEELSNGVNLRVQ